MVRSRLILLSLFALGLAALAAWLLWGDRDPGAADRGGLNRAERDGEQTAGDGAPEGVDDVWGQEGDEAGDADPGDDDPLAQAVTEQDYGVRPPAHYTPAEQAQHRRQFRQRLAGLALGGDAELADCLTLARWAADKEIPALYGLALRYTLLLHSGSTEARRRLARLRRSLRRLPVDRAAGERLVTDLGHDFRVLRTPHFRLAYDTEESFARRIGVLLEQVHRAFFRFFNARHFEPVPPSDRLEVVIFGRRADYRRFTEHLGEHLISTSGVFVSKDNRTYFYDALSEPGLDRSHKNIADSVRSLKGFLEDLDTGDPDRRFNLTVGGQSYREVSRARAQRLLRAEVKRLQRRRRQVDRRFAGRNVTRAVHEIVHHLAYASGVHGRFRRSPKWIVEGLAMYFEAVDPKTGRWQGPGGVNADRQRGFRRDLKAGRGVGLDELVTSDRGFQQAGQQMNRTYNAAWALFHYLVTHHHDALFDLMANLSIEVAAERATEQTRRDEMLRAFGPLGRLERRWLGAW